MVLPRGIFLRCFVKCSHPANMPRIPFHHKAGIGLLRVWRSVLRLPCCPEPVPKGLVPLCRRYDSPDCRGSDRGSAGRPVSGWQESDGYQRHGSAVRWWPPCSRSDRHAPSGPCPIPRLPRRRRRSAVSGFRRCLCCRRQGWDIPALQTASFTAPVLL